MPSWYPELQSVCYRFGWRLARRRAVRAANRELLATHWAVGTDILSHQEEHGWGARVIDRLSADLQERFPDARGFSPRNLKYIRAFAEA